MQEHRDLWWNSPTVELGKVVRLDLSEPFRAVHGGTLASIQVSYESWGELNEARDNAVLVAPYLEAVRTTARLQGIERHQETFLRAESSLLHVDGDRGRVRAGRGQAVGHLDGQRVLGRRLVVQLGLIVDRDFARRAVDQIGRASCRERV